jgi:hypothetical protein
MTHDEIRDDIPADVREALASIMAGLPCAQDSVLQQIQDVIRKRPATLWVLMPGRDGGPLFEMEADAGCAVRALERGFAWATEADAQRALDAMMAREPEGVEQPDSLSDLIPWAYLDPRWTWAAMDECGEWYAYEWEPVEDISTWTGGDCCLLPIPEGAPAHWTKTKVRQPEGV